MALGTAGIINAKTTDVKETVKSVSNIKSKNILKSTYHPITITSSCGYTQVIEVGPNDQPDCWMTDAQQMEDDCSSPFTNPQMAGYWP